MMSGLLPYADVTPGQEAVYVEPDADSRRRGPDDEGPSVQTWSLWTWTGLEMASCPEIDYIDRMQVTLGELDHDTRRIRAHIASLAHCDNGFPVTVEELLEAIGRGKLLDVPFHNGCYWSQGLKGTQPGGIESMVVIEAVLNHYLSGGSEAPLVDSYPYAAGFITRTYEWLGPLVELTPVQRLLLVRMLLPFEFFTKRNENYEEVHEVCFGPDGKGAQLDREIAAAAGLPRIYPNYRPEFRTNLASITDPDQRMLYRTAGSIAHGVRELSDCFHATFRWIERWIHAIGTGHWEIGTRREGVERERLGKSLLGYTLALDRWLAGVPMQFLLLDLGHVHLGFDAKNYILRTYAYLGEERTPVMEWLAASLWYRLYYILHFRDYYDQRVARAAEAGVGLRTWFESLEAAGG